MRRQPLFEAMSAKLGQNKRGKNLGKACVEIG